MKKFLLSTLGAMGLLGQLAAQEPLPAPIPSGPLPAPTTIVPLPGPTRNVPVPAPTTIVPPPAGAHDFGPAPIHGFGPAPSHDIGPAPTVAIDDHDNHGGCAKLFFGAEVLFLRPHHDSDPAFTSTSTRFGTGPGGIVNGNNTTIVNDETRTNTTEFSDKYGAAFRFWLGYQGECGLGIRGRWFHYDHADEASGVGNRTPASTVAGGGTPGSVDTIVSTPSGNLTTPIFRPNVNGIFTPTPRTLDTSRRLFIDSWDAELTQAFECNHCWNFLASAGVRYAYIEQRYNANLVPVVVTDIPAGVPTLSRVNTGSEASRNQFTGAGPTVALEVLRRLGDSNLSLFGDVRGSLLYGRGHLRSEFNTDARTNDLVAGTSTDTITRGGSSTGGYDLLPILELELGAQWARQMGNVEIFLRPSVVSQTYFDGGSATSRSGDFGLFGFALAAGIRF